MPVNTSGYTLIVGPDVNGQFQSVPNGATYTLPAPAPGTPQTPVLALLDGTGKLPVAEVPDLSGTYARVIGVAPSGDTTGATDYTNLTAAIAQAMLTPEKPILLEGKYYVNSPLILKPGNSGTTNVPQQVPSIISLTGAGHIGDEADISATSITATASFPLGQFLIDYQQNGTPYGGSGAVVKGFTLECANRSAGFRAQGPREFHVSDLTIVKAIAPVTPGDNANGGFSISCITNGVNASAYNLFDHITVWCAAGTTGDAFWDSTNGENTYLACRAYAGTGGASYHVANFPSSVPNNTYLDCHYSGGFYGVQMDAGSAATFIGLSLFTSVPWPTKNALLLQNGWQYNLSYYYPPIFQACRFINNPASGVTEADGAVVRFSTGPAYNIDAAFTACMFGTGTAGLMTDWVYSDAGITQGGVVTFRDCIFLGTPTTKKINDQSNLARFYNCKNINPFGSTLPQPAIAASAAVVTNKQGADATVIVAGGTVSAIAIGGTATGLTSGSFRVPSGQTITLTYTVAPTWTWYGD